MKELSKLIDKIITNGEGILKAVQDITNCGEGILMTAKNLRDLFSTDNLPTPNVAAQSVEKALAVKEEQSAMKNYTKEEVRGILSGKSASGHGKEVKALLSKYGADKLSDLKPENYASVAAEAEVIGND